MAYSFRFETKAGQVRQIDLAGDDDAVHLLENLDQGLKDGEAVSMMANVKGVSVPCSVNVNPRAMVWWTLVDTDTISDGARIAFS
ncbi:hypothetical protein OZX67_04005 [Bifidobacterium sp. ESL0728]|uniref:hypothetical protein n=1 Tax=Bifidobacterium sp. ESL0728 TaxID=2983220 RepID=UPI0023F768B9|nr:hypothetical protein [Bifidobacterium sp. ESL0728]WEV59711.1 hypothetical protein OZX67_04005 [Bifidobacterium sp. ESL0728]